MYYTKCTLPWVYFHRPNKEQKEILSLSVMQSMCGWVVLIEMGRKKSKNVGVNKEK
jgi:hypothetical protein